jgi:quinoprotein dehydrogenase-associated probable ABC transporter substrate-binding protein
MQQRVYSLVLAAALLALAGTAAATARAEPFRVCSDPNSLPFSNRDGEGFENRIAAVLAADLGVPVEYTWFPNRRGFIRNTLRKLNPQSGEYPCDVVMGLPDGFEQAITTHPYYRSTYVLVYSRTGMLAGLESPDDLVALVPEQRRGLRIGVFAETPGANWLAKRGFSAEMVAYPALQGDPSSYPGQVIKEDLAQGKLDAAIVWGPIAGYFVSRLGRADVSILPLRSEPGARFDFAIAMGVRHGDQARKEQLDTLLERNHEQIRSILLEYHVPLLDENGKPL